MDILFEYRENLKMNKAWLKEMMTCISPSGKEEMLQKCVYRHYKDTFETFMVEEQGTLTGIYNKDARFKIQLAGHADEISLIVTGYRSDGTLEVDRNGGTRPKLYVGVKVQILTPHGIVKGVMGTNAGILKKADVEYKDLFIDIGCDTKEAH